MTSDVSLRPSEAPEDTFKEATKLRQPVSHLSSLPPYLGYGLDAGATGPLPSCLKLAFHLAFSLQFVALQKSIHSAIKTYEAEFALTLANNALVLFRTSDLCVRTMVRRRWQRQDAPLNDACY